MPWFQPFPVAWYCLGCAGTARKLIDLTFFGAGQTRVPVGFRCPRCHSYANLVLCLEVVVEEVHLCVTTV